MGYRCHTPQSSVRDAVADSSITVRNGSSSDLAFPCFYLEEGADWTLPESLTPIHLIAEGYTEIRIALQSDIDGLVMTGFIDELDDWVIRARVEAFCEAARVRDVKTHYSIVAYAPETYLGPALYDVVATGELTILHAPYVQPE